jgi:hypothetical protein
VEIDGSYTIIIRDVNMNNPYRRARLRLCLLIMGTAILSPSASAQLPSRPDADAARYLRTAAEQSRPVVAIAPNGGWVVALGTRYLQRNIPSELEANLGDFTRAGRSIDAVAFTPDGRGWMVIAGDQSFTRNVGGSGGDAFHGIVNAFLNRGRGVRGVSFNPTNWSRDRGYVIVWDEVTHDQPLTDPRQIEQYANDLRLALEMVDELNLNTRIWSKPPVAHHRGDAAGRA